MCTREALSSEIKRYNSAQVHSTTGEIPDIRFFRTLDDKRSLRIVPDIKTGISEIRFWHNRKLAGTASARNEDLNIQNF